MKLTEVTVSDKLEGFRASKKVELTKSFKNVFIWLSFLYQKVSVQERNTCGKMAKIMA